MIANYHTHTPRCNHAVGSEREYIENALAAGLQTLGFSDHTPYLFPGDYYSTFRMHPEELSGYVATLQALREEYRDRIQLHIGLEAEYYSPYFPQTLDFLRQAGIEYLILGQHYAGNEPFGSYSGRETKDKAVLEVYVRQVISAMDTGRFTYLAHPDLIFFTGSRALYREWMGLLVREAKDHSLPLELNLLGIRDKRNYPNPQFLELVGEAGSPMVLGMDAHLPQSLLDKPQLTRAQELLDTYGIPLLSTVPLISI